MNIWGGPKHPFQSHLIHQEKHSECHIICTSEKWRWWSKNASLVDYIIDFHTREKAVSLITCLVSAMGANKYTGDLDLYQCVQYTSIIHTRAFAMFCSWSSSNDDFWSFRSKNWYTNVAIFLRHSGMYFIFSVISLLILQAQYCITYQTVQA